MKTTTLKAISKRIQDGKIECVTDLKVGAVEIRNTTTGKRETVIVFEK